jgi:hypothetical protein
MPHFNNLLILHKPKNVEFDDFELIRSIKDDTYLIMTHDLMNSNDLDNVFNLAKNKLNKKYDNIGLFFYGFENNIKFREYVFDENNSINTMNSFLDISYIKNYFSKIKSFFGSKRIDLLNCYFNIKHEKMLQKLLLEIDKNNQLYFTLVRNHSKKQFNPEFMVYGDKVIPLLDYYPNGLDLTNIYFKEIVNINIKYIDLNTKPNGIILVPSYIENIGCLLNCCNDNVLIFKYEMSWTYDEFINNLHNLIKNIDYNSMSLFGWIFHGLNNEGKLKICTDKTINIFDKTNLIQWQHFIDIIMIIKLYLSKPCRLDLMGCELGKIKELTDLFDYLETATEIEFALSTDNTGNEYDSDWLLETKNINLLNTYFLPETNQILKQANVIIKLFSFNRNFSVSSSPEDALFDIGEQLLKQNPQLKALVDQMATFANQTFAGKSFLEILSVFTDIIGFIPGPIGFIGGLAGTAISIAIYAEKVKNGSASDLDNLDLVMGCLGCMISCVPGGRAASKIASNSAKIAVKSAQKTQIITKSIKIIDKTTSTGYRLINRSIPKISVAHLSAIKQAVGFAKTSISNSKKYKDGVQKMIDLYGQLGALENILSVVPIGSTDESDGADKLSLSRQSLIDVLSALSKTSSGIDSIGDLRTEDFEKLMVLQYGTATINDNPIYINGDTVPPETGIFIDNETYTLNNCAINRIKINPYTVVTINNTTYTNMSKTDVNELDFSKIGPTIYPSSQSYTIGVSTYEVDMKKYNTSISCAISVSYTTGGTSNLAIGESPNVDILNVLNNSIALYGRGCMKCDNASTISLLKIGPNTNVSLLKAEPRFATANDVICAWSNNSSTELQITNIDKIIGVKVTAPNVYFGICSIDNKPYIYGNYVRLMYQDINKRYINISEFKVRRSGTYIEGGNLKFNKLIHNKTIKPSSSFASSYYLGSTESNTTDNNYDTITHTGNDDKADGSIMPWIEQDVSQGGTWPVYISNIYIANRKDWCRDRMLDSCIAVFDKYRYLVWMSDKVSQILSEYDFPSYGGLRFDLVKINSKPNLSSDLNKKCNFIRLIQVIDINGLAYNNWNFTQPYKPAREVASVAYVKDLMGASNNNNLNTGVAYSKVPRDTASSPMPYLYRYLQIGTTNPLHDSPTNQSTVELFFRKSSNDDPNYLVKDCSDYLVTITDPILNTLNKINITINSNTHYSGIWSNMHIYTIDLWTI